MMSNDVALVLEHAVEADVSLAFAWKFRTDVANWNDPPARFEIDGPFLDGTRGTTFLPGQQPLTWWVRDVVPKRSFVIENAAGRCGSSFRVALRSRGRTRNAPDATHRAGRPQCGRVRRAGSGGLWGEPRRWNGKDRPRNGRGRARRLVARVEGSATVLQRVRVGVRPVHRSSCRKRMRGHRGVAGRARGCPRLDARRCRLRHGPVRDRTEPARLPCPWHRSIS